MFWKIIMTLCIVYLLYDLYALIQRRKQKRKLYKQAVKKSKTTGKKLLVIGDPENGFASKYYGSEYKCGDLCIDLTGCPGCENGIQGKVEDELPKLPDNSYVIFLSCVLEYIDNNKIDFVISELKRVSGGDLYLITVQPGTLTSFFYFGSWFTDEPKAKRMIFENGNEITYVNV